MHASKARTALPFSTRPYNAFFAHYKFIDCCGRALHSCSRHGCLTFVQMAHSAGNSAAAKPDEHASCIRVTDAETAAPYYISAVFRSDADGEECFDLTVTDLKRAWTAAGAGMLCYLSLALMDKLSTIPTHWECHFV